MLVLAIHNYYEEFSIPHHSKYIFYVYAATKETGAVTLGRIRI